MYFNAKRYYYGMLKRRYLFLLLVVIPLLYVFVSALVPDRFQVNQTITISDNTPVAMLSNPVGYMPFHELKMRQLNFFTNSFAVNKLKNELASGDIKNYELFINESIRHGLSINQVGDDSVSLSYYGKYLDLGEALVRFYSDQLLKKSAEGKVRSNNAVISGVQPQLIGDVNIIKLRSFWRSDRLMPLFFITAASLVLTLILIAFIEWNDPSFKSERQIARYTGLPILGNVPDLNKLSKRIDPDQTAVS